MIKRTGLLMLLAALLFSSCAAKRDVIKMVQEPDPVQAEQNERVTVSVSRSPVTVGSTSTATDTGMPSVPYRRFQDMPGVDWTKKVQFSFKEEDIAKLLEFLSNSSGITVVNLGGDVPTNVITDPQSQQTSAQQVNQPYYAIQQQQQQQQAKQDPFKHIGPVSGNVTVYSKGQVSLEEAFKILDVVLLSKGYSAVITGNVMKIIPVAGLRQSNLRIVVNSDPALATEGDDVVLQIIPLKNLTASKIRADISSLIPLWGMIISNDSSNSIIMINSLSNIKTLLTIIDSLEKASTRALSVNVYPLKFGDSKNLANVMNQIFNNTSTVTNQANQFRGPQFGLGGTQQPGETVTIVAETTSNTLIAVATPQTLALIRSTLEQLDRKQSQVLVEVLVVDVALTKDLALGVEWSLPGLPNLGGMIYTGTFASTLGLSGKSPDFSYSLLQGNTSAVIHALMQETKVDVKSAPKILTLDNQKATVTVGQQVPNVTGSQTTSGGQVIYTYNYNTVGTTLEVTPHINQDSFVTMTVHQNVSKITSTTYFGAPVLDNRDAVTSVRVKDGETMVLGGIMTDQTVVTENKIPILGDIPLIGFLFNSSDTITQKNELLIFLTPHIIDNARDSGDTIRSMERRMEKLTK